MVNEVILFPNAEALLIAALQPKFTEQVRTTVPKGYQPGRSPAFIKLSRVGGPRRDIVTDRPMVVFQAWAGTEYEAGELGRLLSAHVYALEGTAHPLGWIGGISEVGGLQSYPDQVSGSPCYQFTTQLNLRGVAI